MVLKDEQMCQCKIANSKKLSADKIKNLSIHIPVTGLISVEIGRIIDVTDDYIYCELDPDFVKSLTRNDIECLSFEIENCPEANSKILKNEGE